MTGFPRWRSLGVRIPVLVLALVAVIVAVVAGASYQGVRAAARDAEAARLEQLAGELATTLAASVSDPVSLAAAAAADPAVLEAAGSAGERGRAAALAAMAPLVGPPGSRATLWDALGRALLTTPDTAVAALPPGVSLQADGPRVTGLAAADDTTIVFSVIAPVGRTPAAWLVNRRRLRIGSAERAALEGLMGPGTGLLFGNADGSLWTDGLGPVEGPLPAEGDREAPFFSERAGTSVLARSSPIPGTPWQVYVERARSLVFAPVRAFLGRLGLIVGGALLLAAVATWGLSRRLTRPLVELAATADRLARGDLAVRARVPEEDELGRLADALNDMAVDIQEEMERARLSAERFGTLVTASAQIVWTADPEGNVQGALPSLQAHTGQSDAELAGTGWVDALHPEDTFATLRAWREALEERRPFEVESRIRGQDGRYRPFVVRGVPMLDAAGAIREWVGTCTDVAERRATEERLRAREEELRQSQKMEAIGRLAGGVAHDFNNLLTAILGPVDLAREQLPPGHPALEDLEDIRAATLRAGELTRQLLSFGRRQVLSAVVLEVKDVVEEAARLLRRIVGERVHLGVVVAPDVGRVFADPTQLHQVILNLAVNARDAMPSGGLLTIEAGNVELDASYGDRHPSVKPGPYVLLAVSDTGTGMDRHTVEHVFEPFFTTKETKGTGLGLATVHGIVKQAGGHIWVYSEPGHGTTFKIYLPRAIGAAEVAARPQSRPAPRHGSETVLLAEDDEGVRKVASRALTRAGYRVLAAPDGETALVLLDQHRDEVGIVVTDVVMPGMTGNELALRLEEIAPGLPALFLSGYADGAVVRHGGVRAGSPFLQKPFTPDALIDKVREVLDASAARGTRAGSA